MGRTRIKICGIKDAESALAAVEAGADAVGFVFVRSSPRFIEPEEADELVEGRPSLVSSVGLFMNMSVERFSDIEEVCPTNFSQLHGDEDEATVRQCGPGVIKAVRFEAGTIGAELARWDAVEEVDAIL